MTFRKSLQDVIAINMSIMHLFITIIQFNNNIRSKINGLENVHNAFQHEAIHYNQ